MSNTFKKQGLRGFTLIELLVVIAIIGLLSTVIAAPITQARKKGRDGKKVADLHQIQGALQQYADDHVGSYPLAISNLVPTYVANLPTNAATTTLAKDKYVYSSYTVTTGGQVVGFHLGTKLEAPALALGDDRDCHGIGAVSGVDSYCQDVSAGPTAAVGDFSIAPGNFTTGATAAGADFPNDNNVSGAAGTGFQVGDFQGGNDTASSTCTALFKATLATQVACIYDITH